ncbi:MAG: VWA domain-containing protein [Anaerolineae bacterium]
MLKDRYEIIELFGSAAGQAAYLVHDVIGQQDLLLWESVEQFQLRQKPPGVREYFEQEGNHYLVLQLRGQTLAFLLLAAGRIDEMPAGLWMLQICRSVGYWHRRDEGALICLRQGSLRLNSFRLSEADLVMIPSYGELGSAEQGAEAGDYAFSAPETEPEDLSPRSDVYALGSMLYCLLTGAPPPDPGARAARRTRLESPRKVNGTVSKKMEAVVSKALQMDPRRRYPTAAEMADEMEAFLVPQLQKPKDEEPRPSLLARAVPFFVTLALLACLAVALDQIIGERHLDLSWLPRGRPMPTSTPGPTMALPDTATPTPTASASPTPAPTATPLPLPILKTVVNQVRTDKFPEMIVYVSALDEEQEPYSGLVREQVTVQQDDEAIVDFLMENVSAAKDPLSMVVAIDISGSMKGSPLNKARQAAANFVGRFDVVDQVALVKFDDRIELVHGFTTDKDSVIEAINSLRSRGDTALYDVIAYSVRQLEGQTGRRAVVVLTDGRDTASKEHSLPGSIEVANGSSIPIFVVGLDSPQFTPDVMERIASSTGGDYLYAPTPDDLDALYQKIRGQLQNQYRIQFSSLHEADDRSHLLRIGIDLGGGQWLWGEKQYRLP